MFFKKFKNLKYFKKFYSKYKKSIFILTIVMLLASSLGMLLPYFISERLISLTNINSNEIIKLSIIIMTIIFFHHIFWFFWEKITSSLQNHVAKDIRYEITKKFLDTKYDIIKKNTSSFYLERLSNDTNQIACVLGILMGTFVDCLTNFSFLIVIYFLNWQCGLFFTIGTIFLYLIDTIKIKKDIYFTDTINKLNEILNSKTIENYKGIKDIKGLNLKNKVLSNYSNINNELTKLRIKKDITNAKYSRLKTFGQYMIESLLLVFAVCYLLPNNNVTVVLLLTILNYAGFMYDLVNYFANMKECINKGEYSSERILEILNENNFEIFGTNKILNNNYDLEIKDLTYKFENINSPILKNINLKIKQNSMVAIIGESGSGKTTLFNILAKLLQVENNKIFISKQDINNLSEEEIRKQIALINQETFLFNENIMNNLKIREDCTNDEIYECCKITNIYKDIFSFENNYQTIIIENGNNLSGGQKQRLSIARALLSSSNILLFDEPTSALDKDNQTNFYNILKNLKGKKTIIVITHKINDYSIFDKVIELKNGFVINKN